MGADGPVGTAGGATGGAPDVPVPADEVSDPGAPVPGAPVPGAPDPEAPDPGAPDPAGAELDAGAGVSRIDRVVAPEVPRFSQPRSSASVRKIAARIAVVRVSRLAVPRPDMNEPMPCELPIPSPPPSLRWISTTPIRASATNR